MTGGHGFLGRRLVRRAVASGWDVVAPTSAELDVRAADEVTALVAAQRPDAVVHLAYRRSERDTIVDGSRAVAAATAAHGTRLVHLSTDVVFGGRATPYGEADLPHPIEAYGAAKADAEAVVADACPGAALVRTSLLLGEPDDLGQSELDVVAALSGARPFTFFTDEVRSPARATDVAAAVFTLAAELTEVSGPLHVAGPEALTRLELATRLAEQLGLDAAGLQGSSLDAAGFAGRRPGRVVLDSTAAGTLGLTCRPV